MKIKIMVQGALVLATLLLGGILTAGVALGYVGQTYAKASAAIEARNWTVAIRTVVGSELAISDCIVTNAQASKSQSRKYLLDLNCTNLVAAAGKPGKSVTTQEGKAAKAFQVQANKWDREVSAFMSGGKKIPWCGQDESRIARCFDLCARYGVCSQEVLDYLARS